MLVAIIGILIYVWLAWNFDYWRKRGVPGPTGHLLSGSFPKSFYQQRNIVYDVEEAYRYIKALTVVKAFLDSIECKNNNC